jgi:NADH:ubiquinone oxidoreductase subunit 3 (subunit A)
MFAQASDQLYRACNEAQNCPAEYSDLLRQYLIVFFLAVLAVGLVAGMLAVAGILRPRPRTGRYQGQKLTTYESGVDPVGSGWSQSNVRYYVFALLFVLFDVEAIFIFPWALQLEVYGTFGLVEMLVFIAILVLGLVYAWRKKVLQWL